MGFDARERTNDGGWVHPALTVVYVFSLLLSFITYGAVDPRAFGVISIIVFGLGLATLLLLGIPARNRPIFSSALLVLGVLSVWAFMQTLDLSLIGLGNRIWGDSAPISGYDGASISLAPGLTLYALPQLGVPFVMFLTGLMLSPDDASAERLLRRLTLLGGLVALVGLVQYMIAPFWVLFAVKHAYFDSLTSVFVNRNTAATFLGLTLICLVSLTWLSLRDGGTRLLQAWMTGRSGFFDRRVFGLLTYLALVPVTAISLVLTNSRAGAAATLIALLLLTPVMIVEWRRNSAMPSRPGRSRTRLILTVLAALVVASLIVGAPIVMRIDEQVYTEARFCVFPSALEAVRLNFLGGTGFGTFLEVFPAYRALDCGPLVTWDRAHNSYIEALLGFGVIFIPVLLYALYQLAAVLMAGLRTRRSARIFPALGVAALILVGLHSLLDFSLQIPGFALFFAAILAPIVSISEARNIRPTKSRKHRHDPVTLQIGSTGGRQ